MSTASYQIEGAGQEDGRGPCIWDMFSRKPGATFQSDNGDVACDHYHRYPEDVRLMQELGVGAYRLSLSWPRILPEGTGRVEPRGLEFYDRLIDEVLAAGITPWVTLFHWDYPLALYHRGGWLNPDSPKWFADYTQVVVDALSDRVQHWMTQNEPQVFIGCGLHTGAHAPGDKLRWDEVLLAIHHTLVAHGLSTQVIRARAKTPPFVGIAPACPVGIPATAEPADIEAARSGTFGVTSQSPWHISWWLDPVYLGCYPEDGLKVNASSMPPNFEDDLAVICQPIDFLGMNVYQGRRIKAGEGGEPVEIARPSHHPITAFKWPIEPECLYWGPRFYWERYGKPIFITENGLSNQDSVMLDGKVHDPQRIDYLHRHLLQLRRAAEDDVSVGGYFQWSLMDNFEWAEGYRERFGLIFVDYDSQRRIPKDSYYWYRDTIAASGANL